MRLVMTWPAIKNECDEFCRLVCRRVRCASHRTDSMVVILIPSSPFTIYLTPLSPYFLVCLDVDSSSSVPSLVRVWTALVGLVGHGAIICEEMAIGCIYSIYLPGQE